MALFESYERRINQITPVLAEYGISSIEECLDICKSYGFNPYDIVAGVQPICFENARWAYTVGAAIAIKKGVKTAAEAAEAIGIGRVSTRISRQNVVIAIAIKLIVILLGFLGWANMWAAVFADTGVAMICILNSIRILYRK